MFNDTITTVQDGDVVLAEMANVPYITADEITVTVDGTEYVCPKVQIVTDCIYGGVDPDTGHWDFTDYPFAIASYGADDTWFSTENAGTYTVKVEATTETVTTTPCFEKAVKTVVDRGYECKESVTELFEANLTTSGTGGEYRATLPYSEPITSDKIFVHFDGEEYVCERQGHEYHPYYGDFNFIKFPFAIGNPGSGNVIFTQTANTYHIGVAAAGMEATNISPCFASAVRKASGSSVKIKTATLSADNVSVDGSEAVLLSVPSDYSATVGVITIYPLETEDVYLTDFDCSGDRRRFYLNYKSKQSSPVTLGHVSCVFTYIPIGDK